MLEQNHDFNSLLISYEKYIQTIANFYLNNNRVNRIGISRYPAKGLPNEGSEKFGNTTS